MVDKKFIGLSKPDITRFESYLPTAFSSELSLLQKVNEIIQDLNRNFDLSNEMVEYLNHFIETFDEKLYGTIEDVLTVWLEDGRLADVVRVSINEEVIEARNDIENETHLKLNKRLDKWENRAVRLEDDVKTKHYNIDWYVPRETTNYTAVFDELIDVAVNTKVPIYLPEFKTYKCDRDYPPNLFYGNGRLINVVTGKEIQISKTPDNIYQYSQGEMKHKNLYGTFNNAVMQSLMANDITHVPEILGIDPEHVETLSTYNNRDNAVQFLSISSHTNFLEFKASEVTYVHDGVIIPSLNESMDIPVGSILDTRHSPFYSALVKSVDYVTKKISVHKGWYKTDGSKVIKTPPNDLGMTINRTTAVWVANWLIFLNGDDENTACSILEAGIINEQPKVDNVTGIDMLLMGTYGGNNAFQARGRTAKWLRGFADEGSDTSFLSENATNGVRVDNARDVAFSAYNTPVALRNIGLQDGLTIYTTVDGSPYRVNNNGIQNKIGFEYDIVNTNKEVNLQFAIHIVRTGVTKVTLPTDEKHVGLMIEIFSLNDNSFDIEGFININGSTATGYNVARKGESVRLFCDGGVWYKMGD